VGGFRNDFEGAQDYDFLLRAVENAKKICHKNKVLYHWRSHSGSIASNAWCKGYAHESGKKALQEHLCRQQTDALVLNGKDPFRFNVRYRHNLRPAVSIILFSQGRTDFIKSSIKSILGKSTYGNYEIMIANANGLKVDHDCLVGLDDSGHSIKWLDYRGSYNWSAVNNLAAKFCSGDVLIFLDECLEVVSPDWIESLIEHALRCEIGAVGGLVLSPEGRVLNAGLVLGQNGGTDYICAGMTLDEVGANPVANLMVNYVRNVSAVSGSCLCVSRKKFLEAGGFESRVEVGGDVNLCLKLLILKYFNIHTPFSILSCKDASYGRNAIPIDAVSGEDICSKFRVISGMKDPYYSENFNHSSRVPAIGGKSTREHYSSKNDEKLI
jgi:O-antigen biosynthesis protein